MWIGRKCCCMYYVCGSDIDGIWVNGGGCCRYGVIGGVLDSGCCIGIGKGYIDGIGIKFWCCFENWCGCIKVFFFVVVGVGCGGGKELLGWWCVWSMIDWVVVFGKVNDFKGIGN